MPNSFFPFHEFLTLSTVMPSCAAVGCSVGCQKGISRFKFPLKDPERLHKWVQNCGRDGFTPSKYSYLCVKHFEDDQVDRTGECIYFLYRNGVI